jgi:sugar phosphate isomerase/epimerase
MGGKQAGNIDSRSDARVLGTPGAKNPGAGSRGNSCRADPGPQRPARVECPRTRATSGIAALERWRQEPQVFTADELDQYVAFTAAFPSLLPIPDLAPTWESATSGVDAELRQHSLFLITRPDVLRNWVETAEVIANSEPRFLRCVDFGGAIPVDAQPPVRPRSAGGRLCNQSDAGGGDERGSAARDLPEWRRMPSSAGVTILIEALPKAQCDVVQTLAEAAGLVGEIASPAIRTMFDVHNAIDEIEPHAALVDRYFRLIRHVHVNELDGRHCRRALRFQTGARYVTPPGLPGLGFARGFRFHTGPGSAGQRIDPSSLNDIATPVRGPTAHRGPAT